MVGAGDVVAHRLRRVAAKEDGAGIDDPVGQRLRVVDGQFQVARGVLALNTTPDGFRVKQPSQQNPSAPSERVEEPSATG